MEGREPGLLMAKESATFDYEGQPVFINAGQTVVRAGHPIALAHSECFEPLRVHYDLPPTVDTKADPRGEKEAEDKAAAEAKAAAAKADPSAPRSPVRADQGGARTRGPVTRT
jgi:hypothetical protein